MLNRLCNMYAPRLERTLSAYRRKRLSQRLLRCPGESSSLGLQTRCVSLHLCRTQPCNTCTKDPRGYLSLYGKSVSLEGLQCDNQPAREGYIMTQDKLHGMTAVTNRGMQVSEVA